LTATPVADLEARRDDPRGEARRLIVQAANRQKVSTARRFRGNLSRPRWDPVRGEVETNPVATWHPKLYSMRHLQQAVRVCRHNRLVDEATLSAAGFRPPRLRLIQGGRARRPACQTDLQAWIDAGHPKRGAQGEDKITGAVYWTSTCPWTLKVTG